MLTLGIGAALLLCSPTFGHGGRYRGPGDVVPPNTGPGGPRTPGTAGPSPSGPSSPGGRAPASPGAPAAPGTGGLPGRPGGPPGRGATTGGGFLDHDLTSWQFWWEFNNAPFLNLRDAIHSGDTLTAEEEFFRGDGYRTESAETLAPSQATIRDRIVPALVAMLDSTDDRDVTSSCLIALAKIGIQPENVTLRELFLRRLTENDQEIRETAALALGLSQDESAVPDLIALATGSEEGRRLRGGSVSARTRTFATYGLGLIAHATADNDLRQTIAETLIEQLRPERQADRNQPISVILSLGLLHPGSDLEGRTIRARAVESLLGYYEADLGKSAQLIQSHVPTSIARLFESANLDERWVLDLHERCRTLFLRDLRGRGKKDQYDVARSCTLALARMSGPNDGPLTAPEPTARRQLDLQVSKTLQDLTVDARDHQTRFFASIALGRQGGLANRDFLLRRLRASKSRVEKPWPALALGILAYRAREQGVDVGPQLIGERLMAELETKSPEVLGGVATALGLVAHEPAADRVRSILVDQSSNDQLAGHLSVALALIGDEASIPTLRELASKSVRRVDRLRQSAMALGKLGDKHAQRMLLDMLTSDERPGVNKMAALSSALVMIGDRESVEPLIRAMENEDMTPFARAFAAVALGGIADKELLPWNAKLSVGINYRAAVETLTGSSAGVLDIL